MSETCDGSVPLHLGVCSCALTRVFIIMTILNQGAVGGRDGDDLLASRWRRAQGLARGLFVPSTDGLGNREVFVTDSSFSFCTSN